LACQAGVNVVAGTGTIGFGRDKSGKSARAGGWGEFCGDEGSAYWLGKRAMTLFSKQADGRLTRTPLYDLMRNHLKLRRDLDLLSLVYDGLKDSRKDIAQLAVVLYNAVQLGDPYAIDAYREAAHETSLIVRAIIGQLNFDQEHPTLVSYSGGVFSAGKWVLEPLRSYLSDINIELVTPIFSPVIGAALYALITDKELKDWTDVVGRLHEQIRCE
jgi:N-acetylglucosamine kinase-like BadF-type ATPase